MKNLMSKLSVAAQLFTGFGPLIAAAVIAGGIAVFGMVSFANSFDTFEIKRKMRYLHLKSMRIWPKYC